MTRETADLKKYRLEGKIEVILDDLDFSWHPSEMEYAVNLWNSGESISNMAEIFKREEDEIGLLIIHLSRCGEIERRKGGIYGEQATRTPKTCI
jgi:hypothetical protein